MNVRGSTFLLLGAIGCSGKDTPPPCGISAVVGPSVLLSEFSRAGQTLATAPANVPERIVVRLVAGPALSAIAGRSDSQWVIGVNGAVPPNATPGYGVLVLDLAEKPLGVLLYEGEPIQGAPVLGSVNLGALVVPLIGIRVDPERIQDPRCPLFPDSLAR